MKRLRPLFWPLAVVATLAACAGGPPVPDYSSDSYWQLHEWSVNNPERFWSLIWRFCGIVGHRGTGGGAERVGVGLDHMGPPDPEKGPRWFPDASLNVAENLLRFSDDQPALASWNEQGHQRTLTFKELREAVGTLALALSASGVQRALGATGAAAMDVNTACTSFL